MTEQMPHLNHGARAEMEPVESSHNLNLGSIALTATTHEEMSQQEYYDYALGLLTSNVSEIQALQNIALSPNQDQLSTEEAGNSLGGALRIAYAKGQPEVVSRQLSSWAVYFTRQIEFVLGLYPALESGQIKDARIVASLFGISNDILQAFDRVVTKNIKL